MCFKEVAEIFGKFLADIVVKLRYTDTFLDHNGTLQLGVLSFGSARMMRNLSLPLAQSLRTHVTQNLCLHDFTFTV